MAIDVNNLSVAAEEILKVYADGIYKATESGIAAAEKVLIKDLKATSPRKTGEYQKGWKAKGKRWKLKRYVGNTKTVKQKGGEIPLSNILEYASKSKYKGQIKRTYQNAIPKMEQAIINEIKKEA